VTRGRDQGSGGGEEHRPYRTNTSVIRDRPWVNGKRWGSKKGGWCFQKVERDGIQGGKTGQSRANRCLTKRSGKKRGRERRGLDMEKLHGPYRKTVEGREEGSQKWERANTKVGKRKA